MKENPKLSHDCKVTVNVFDRVRILSQTSDLVLCGVLRLHFRSRQMPYEGCSLGENQLLQRRGTDRQWQI